MANSYIAIPNVLPGNVTIGGNLIVAGNEITVGSFARKFRFGVLSNAAARIGWNQLLGGTTRDDTNVGAQSLYFGSGVVPLGFEYENVAGSIHDTSPCNTILTDFAAHAHTGTVTQDQIYAKTIRGNLLGANGALRINVGVNIIAQGGGSTILRVNFGGNQVLVVSISAADVGGPLFLQGIMFNQNNASVQNAVGIKSSLSATALASPSPAATNSTVDQVLQVTVQNSVVGDSQTFNFISIEQLNTYGPVT